MCTCVCPVFHTCAALLAFRLMRPTYISSRVSSATLLQQAEPSLSSVFCPLPRRPGTPLKIPPLACFLLQMSVPPTPFSPYKKTARVWLLGAWPPPPQCLCMNAEKKKNLDACSEFPAIRGENTFSCAHFKLQSRHKTQFFSGEIKNLLKRSPFYFGNCAEEGRRREEKRRLLVAYAIMLLPSFLLLLEGPLEGEAAGAAAAAARPRDRKRESRVWRQKPFPEGPLLVFCRTAEERKYIGTCTECPFILLPWMKLKVSDRLDVWEGKILQSKTNVSHFAD